MTFRRGFKLTADANIQGGYVAELESIHGTGNAYLTLVFYDEQQAQLRELLEKNDGHVMLYLGECPKVNTDPAILRPDEDRY